MRRGRSPQRRGRGGRPPQRQERYPLPEDTGTLAEAYAGRCLNYGLRTERLLLCDERTWELSKQSKERQGVRAFNQGDLQRIVNAHRKRWKAMLNDYDQSGYKVKQFPMRAVSRVIVGLGVESVLETSVRLHRIYGFPIIPGSALKGLARSYAELVEGKNENDATFAAVFGQSPPAARAGQVIFFDAIPANSANLRLDLDVMNPHYSEYYRGGNIPPADYLNPVPIYFLTVGPGSEFLFAVISERAELASQAEFWLRGGLTELGVGAKTTAGYGFFEGGSDGTSK